MGYLLHKAMIVNGWDGDAVAKAHEAVVAIYSEGGQLRLVSPVIPHVCNGGASFFIAPDGSKEGWSESNLGDELRESAKVALNAVNLVDWCEVMCGGDDGQCAILSHNMETIA